MIGPADPPITLPLDVVRHAVFDSNTTVQDRFRSEFPAEIERAIAGITAAHRALDLFRSQLQGSNQMATIDLFFHSAVNSVLSSLHHLVSGYPIAAGKLVGPFTESGPKALLLFQSLIGEFHAPSPV